jgi:hypothetical protein
MHKYKLIVELLYFVETMLQLPKSIAVLAPLVHYIAEFVNEERYASHCYLMHPEP